MLVLGVPRGVVAKAAWPIRFIKVLPVLMLVTGAGCSLDSRMLTSNPNVQEDGGAAERDGASDAGVGPGEDENRAHHPNAGNGSNGNTGADGSAAGLDGSAVVPAVAAPSSGALSTVGRANANGRAAQSNGAFIELSDDGFELGPTLCRSALCVTGAISP